MCIAVWPTDIPKSSTWVSGQLGSQHQLQYPTVFANVHNGRRPAVRSPLQRQYLPRNDSDVVIENPQLQWVITSRNKNPNPEQTLSYHNIQYSVKQHKSKLIGNFKPYPILKGIR